MVTEHDKVVNDENGSTSEPNYNFVFDPAHPERQFRFSDPKRVLTKKQRIFGAIWDAFGKEPEERRFVMRLDFFLFTYSLISYVIKILDQTNINNAFVSGMQQDLKLYGQERNLFTTFFNMGYLTGSLPGQVFINAGVRSSYFIPSCEIVWAVFVMCIAACQSARAIYGLRFIIGLAESSIFPGFSVILGAWYTPSELGKRIALFEMSAQVASMFSGYIQAGLYASMNGRYGIAGWRWLFIIDGVISMPVAILGFFAIPDFPNTTKAFYLKPYHRSYAMARMDRIGRTAHVPLTVKMFTKMFMTARPYLFTLINQASGFGSYTGYFNLWLRSLHKYSVPQLNTIPTGGNAIGLVSAYLISNLSDLTNSRWPWIFGATCFPLLGAILLTVWNIPDQAKMFANFIAYAGAPSQPLTVAWASEVFQDVAATRGIIMGFANTINYAMSAWIPLVFFPTPQAPHYKMGYQWAIACNCLQLIVVVVFLWYVKWERKHNGYIINEFGLPVVPLNGDVIMTVSEMKEDINGEKGMAERTVTISPV
ncbi:major facilitator superfamily domain-containing protein [Lipomyces arxii]|uniref:major facilitator superfamily domain-containing protein n=1 Tax=Lipomyces arxii TaxID=56418 RepID=UPI0034CD78D4